jgi:hypothetical protein
VSSNKSFTLFTPPDHREPRDSFRPAFVRLPVAHVTPHAKHTHSSARAVPVLLALLAGMVAALTLSGTAPAATSSKCGEQVLADWFDNGRIDRLYPLHCYEEAIDAIPDDIRDYADAEEVISRALQSALRGDLDEGGCDPSPDGSANDCKRTSGGSNGNSSGGGNNSGGGNDSGGGNESENPGQVAPEVDTSGPSSVPIPLLVLGGMSLALLAAGGLGYLSRRRQAVHADDLGDDETLV